jgi:hypothetical protein
LSETTLLPRGDSILELLNEFGNLPHPLAVTTVLVAGRRQSILDAGYRGVAFLCRWSGSRPTTLRYIRLERIDPKTLRPCGVPAVVRPSVGLGHLDVLVRDPSIRRDCLFNFRGGNWSSRSFVQGFAVPLNDGVVAADEHRLAVLNNPSAVALVDEAGTPARFGLQLAAVLDELDELVYSVLPKEPVFHSFHH